MERIIKASKSEVTAQSVVVEANKKRINSRKLIETALNYDNRLPEPVKDIIKNVAFFKSYRTKSSVA